MSTKPAGGPKGVPALASADRATNGWRQIALADLAGLRARNAAVFTPDWRKRAVTLGTITGAVALLFYGFVALEFSPVRIFNGFGELIRIIGLMLPPTWGTTEKLLTYLNALGETLAIAFLGTLLAAIISFPLALLAARNTTVHFVLRFFTRRLSDTVRGIETLIWALIWINVVGLGPFAGVLAVMTSDIGSFIKLFSEAVEATDNKPVEGVVSSGGTRSHATRFAVLPQVLPVIAGQILYFFESNTRSSTIIGIVGAGGIGLHLSEQIRTLEFQHVSFLILLILATVTVIDWISSRLRLAIAGERAR